MDDLVPEHCEYSDDGCDLFPSCLDCPLATCRYDHPWQHTAKELRDGEMRRLHGGGMGVNELAQRFGLSKRTVYRAVAAGAVRSAAAVPSTASRGEDRTPPPLRERERARACPEPVEG